MSMNKNEAAATTKPDDFETRLALALAESRKYAPKAQDVKKSAETELDFNTRLQQALAESRALAQKAKAKDEKISKDVVKAPDTNADAALALKLYQQELAEAAASRAKIEQADEEYAKRLNAQALDLKHKEEETAQKFEALKKIQALLGAPLMKDVDANAHKYTISDIRPNLPVFIGIDDTYQFSDKTLSLDKVEKEILEFVANIPPNMSPPSIENIKKTFELVKAEKSAVEATETLANVPELLSRTWTLTKKMGVDFKINEERGKIARLLADNIGFAGGCMAGLVARIYTGSYPSMIGTALEMSLDQPLSAAAAPVKLSAKK